MMVRDIVRKVRYVNRLRWKEELKIIWPQLVVVTIFKLTCFFAVVCCKLNHKGHTCLNRTKLRGSLLTIISDYNSI